MIHDITSSVARQKAKRRKGRGEGSGRGKTCGRGTKGSKARVGTYIKRGYEGGQTPIFRRLPKRGFSNENFENRFHVVNIGELQRFENDSVVDAAALIEAGLVPDNRLPVKILGNGEMTRKLTVAAGWFSHSAHEKITQAGGIAQNAAGDAFKFPRPKPRPASARSASGTKQKKKQAASEPVAAESEPAAEKTETSEQ